MQRLAVEYRVNLPQTLLVKLPDNGSISSQSKFDGFDVEISFSAELGAARRAKRERHFTSTIGGFLVRVSRPETEVPPEVSTTNGTRDFTSRIPYFNAREPAYGKAVTAAVRRLLLYFRDVLHQPISSKTPDLGEPKWTDENGSIIEHGSLSFMLAAPPGIGPKQYGIKPFRPKNREALTKALAKERKPFLSQELLADAQRSAFDGNLRRAVFELAMSCEIAVKKKFFGKSSAATLAFDYFQDKGHLKVPVLNLLHDAAKQVFGRSFRDHDNKLYQSVDYLFRCRNKVAHRGKLAFRDDSGTTVIVTANHVEEWMTAVRKLFKWLRKLPPPS